MRAEIAGQVRQTSADLFGPSAKRRVLLVCKVVLVESDQELRPNFSAGTFRNHKKSSEFRS
jgi:hypothetical protein